MANWIDSALNWIIPPAVVIFILWILYKAFKPMTEGLGGFFSGTWSKIKGEDTQNHSVKTLEYE